MCIIFGKRPAFETDLIGNLPTSLLPRSSGRASSKRGMHLTLHVPPCGTCRNGRAFVSLTARGGGGTLCELKP